MASQRCVTTVRTPFLPATSTPLATYQQPRPPLRTSAPASTLEQPSLQIRTYLHSHCTDPKCTYMVDKEAEDKEAIARLRADIETHLWKMYKSYPVYGRFVINDIMEHLLHDRVKLESLWRMIDNAVKFRREMRWWYAGVGSLLTLTVILYSTLVYKDPITLELELATKRQGKAQAGAHDKKIVFAKDNSTVGYDNLAKTKDGLDNSTHVFMKQSEEASSLTEENKEGTLVACIGFIALVAAIAGVLK